MKKKIRLITFIVVVFCSTLSSQSPPKNLLQVKTNLYFFKESELRFNPVIIPFNLVYSKFLKDKPYFVGGNFSDFLAYYYGGDYWRKKRGDVEARSFITIGVHGGYRLQVTPKRTFLIKVGLSYRLGYESRFYSIIQKPTYTEIINTQHKYRNLGFEVSAEQQFMLGERWSFSVGGGSQYFISKATTNYHLWVNAGVGYAFQVSGKKQGRKNGSQ